MPFRKDYGAPPIFDHAPSPFTLRTWTYKAAHNLDMYVHYALQLEECYLNDSLAGYWVNLPLTQGVYSQGLVTDLHIPNYLHEALKYCPYSTHHRWAQALRNLHNMPDADMSELLTSCYSLSLLTGSKRAGAVKLHSEALRVDIPPRQRPLHILGKVVGNRFVMTDYTSDPAGERVLVTKLLGGAPQFSEVPPEWIHP